MTRNCSLINCLRNTRLRRKTLSNITRVDRLDIVKLQHVPRSVNKMADILASLAITLVMGAEEKITTLVCSRSVVLPGDEDSEEDANITYVLKIDEENWCQPIIEYLEHEKISSHPNHKIKIQWRAPRFLYYNETLYRCFFFLPLVTMIGCGKSNASNGGGSLGCVEHTNQGHASLSH